MVGIKKDLPSIDELDKLGIKATQDTDRENRIEALLEKRGWGKTFNYVDPSIRKQLGYRIVRKLIGGWYTVGSTRYHQRGYGWALVVAFIMLGAVISSLVQISAGFVHCIFPFIHCRTCLCQKFLHFFGILIRNFMLAYNFLKAVHCVLKFRRIHIPRFFEK